MAELTGEQLQEYIRRIVEESNAACRKQFAGQAHPADRVWHERQAALLRERMAAELPALLRCVERLLNGWRPPGVQGNDRPLYSVQTALDWLHQLPPRTCKRAFNQAAVLTGQDADRRPATPPEELRKQPPLPILAGRIDRHLGDWLWLGLQMSVDFQTLCEKFNNLD